MVENYEVRNLGGNQLEVYADGVLVAKFWNEKDALDWIKKQRNAEAMSDPRDAYRTRGGSMTPEELFAKARSAFWVEPSRKPSAHDPYLRAAVNLVLEEAAKEADRTHAPFTALSIRQLLGEGTE